jgi:hypothetical protein
MEHCDRCLSHIDRIERNEMDIRRLEKNVNQIKTFVILGMSSVILHLAIVIFKGLLG